MLNKIIKKSEEIILSKNTPKKEISKFDDECKKYLTDVNKRMKLCIDSFNNISLEISDIMLTVLPNDKDTKRANMLLTELIKLKPMEPISVFIDKVYSNDEYRNSIKTKNDSFFLEKDHKKLTNNDKQQTTRLFKFKEFWMDLDSDVKDTIKNMMLVLVNLTAKYIEEMDNGNEVAIIMKKINSI